MRVSLRPGYRASRLLKDNATRDALTYLVVGIAIVAVGFYLTIPS